MIVQSCHPGSKAAVDIKDANKVTKCVFVQVTIDKLAAVALCNDKYLNAASYYALSKLLMDFKEHFAENPEIYEDATHDTELDYP